VIEDWACSNEDLGSNPVLMGSRCEYELLTSILVQNKNKPNYEVALRAKPWLVTKQVSNTVASYKQKEKTVSNP